MPEGARERFVGRLREKVGDRSQAEVAREIGIDQASMSRYLRGVKPSQPNARRIVRCFPDLEDAMTAFLLWEDGRRAASVAANGKSA